MQDYSCFRDFLIDVRFKRRTNASVVSCAFRVGNPRTNRQNYADHMSWIPLFPLCVIDSPGIPIPSLNISRSFCARRAPWTLGRAPCYKPQT